MTANILPPEHPDNPFRVGSGPYSRDALAFATSNPAPANRPLVPTRDDLEAFNAHTRQLDELARIHDLAFEMLSILESISRREHLMEWELESGIAYRIRRVLKEAHGE